MVITKSSKKVDDRIAKRLLELGIKPNLKGFHLLKRAIYLTMRNGCRPIPVTKELYPQLAKEFEETSSRVERAIRHAISSSQVDGVKSNSNKEFVAMVALEMSMQRFAD